MRDKRDFFYMILKYQSTLLLSIFICSYLVNGAHINDKCDSDVCTNEKTDGSFSPTTLAIIGCGPSGIAILHAINHRRKKMEDEGDFNGLSKLPIATCFDRSSGPGGVWRSQRSHFSSDDETNSAHIEETSMYEALWTNGPKELLEFFDYTHEDHFNNSSVPPYLPRQLVLDYMLTRVQRNEPNFFSNAKFDTNVELVQFNERLEKFEITLNDITSHKTSTVHFDKCVWAGGSNGVVYYPRSIESKLQEGKFKGKMMHSSSAGNFLSEVKGKRILMIGDAYSAEDLTLQALKLGVDTVYILSRSGKGLCVETPSWPKGKVHILEKMVLTEVLDEGYGLRLSEAAYDPNNGSNMYVPDGTTIDIEDISAVIYCTGYSMDFSMLDAPLRDAHIEYNEELYEFKEYLEELDMSSNWVMSPNSMTETLGTVEPEEWIYSCEVGVTPGIYRGLLISNPNMMYMLDGGVGAPLFELDVLAWTLLSYLVGDLDIPSQVEMTRRNTQFVSDSMQVPYWRFMMDTKYQTAWLDNIESGVIKDDDERSGEMLASSIRFIVMEFAQRMRDISYPVNIGNKEKLNKAGKLIVNMHLHSLDARSRINPNSEESAWKTFRDDDPSHYVSLFTGNVAAPFDKHWIDLDEKNLNW